MPKPPTAQRGRPARAAPAPSPLPERQRFLRRLIPAPAVAVAAPRPVGGGRRGAEGRQRRRREVSGGEQWAEPDTAEAAATGVGSAAGARAVSLPFGMSWRAATSTLLCLIGLAMSVYLTIVHFANYVAACVGGVSIISCQTVLHSPQSVIFGIPVPVLGLAFFVPMLALCSPWAWRSANRYLAPLRLAGVVTGVGMVCYLIYAELFVIGKICLDCSAVHLVTLLLFVVVATGWDEARSPVLAEA